MDKAQREAARLALASPFACCVLEGDGHVRYGNRAFWSLMGEPNPPEQGIHPAPRALRESPVYDRRLEVLESGYPVELSTRLADRSLSCWLLPTCDGVAVLMLDVDEDAPAVTQAEYHRLFNTVSEAIYVQDRDGVFLDVNEAAVRMYGYEKADLVGRTPEMLAAPDRVDLDATLQHVERAFEGEPQMFEWWGKRRNGEVFPKEITLTPATYYGQEVVIGLARDVTERKKAEETARQAELREIEAERLRALGQVAAGVAHDFNNALTAILGYAQVIQGKTDDPEALIQGLRVIEQAARGASVTVRRIQSFVRQRDEHEMDRMDLRTALRDAVALTRPRSDQLEASLGRSFRIRTRVGDIPLITWANEADLRDVFVNLILNALDSMPEGGTVSMTAWAEEGDRAVVEVTDQGTGIAPDMLERIYEPFFTTKGERGTGLGLPVSAGIVRRHGGEIDIRSEAGHGTTFRVSLPRDGQNMNENRRPARSTRPARILVADDETLVRRTLEHLLTRMGHQVSAVGSGLEALHRLEAEAFDLVLTDLSMPGMGGIAVVRAVRRQHPSTKVAVLTGYAPDTELEEGLKEAHAVVHKPVGLAELSEALADLLG